MRDRGVLAARIRSVKMIIQGTTEQMVEKGASLLSQASKDFIRKKGRVVLAVPGGRSVAGIFKLFGSFRLEWQKVHIFMLDERLVPNTHPDSNYRLVQQSLGQSAAPCILHPFLYEPERPEESVAAYTEELERYGTGFDIVLASSGEDGHVGSLFPNHPSVQAKGDGFILVKDSPKPPPDRMSAGVELLRRADTGLLLFFGDTKRKALRNFCNRDLTYTQCPAKIVSTMSNHYVFCDQEELPNGC